MVSNNSSKLKKVAGYLRASFGKKIFCISFQRTGTTSTGQFFIDHGYSVATWAVGKRNKWSVRWIEAADLRLIAELLMEFEIDAVIATNTTIERTGVEELEHGHETGGLSGSPVLARSNQTIYDLF